MDPPSGATPRRVSLEGTDADLLMPYISITQNNKATLPNRNFIMYTFNKIVINGCRCFSLPRKRLNRKPKVNCQEIMDKLTLGSSV